MSELQEVQRAGAKVLDDAVEALARGEMSAATWIGFRLTVIAMMMKPAYRPAGLKIAREYAILTELDGHLLEEQVRARIYEHVQLARLERGLTDEC